MEQKKLCDKICEIQQNHRGVSWVEFTPWQELTFLKHAYSTRLGGVSKGPYASLNLRYTVGDDAADVRENYRLFCEALSIPYERLVYTHQTHTTNVIYVGEADAGNGFTTENRFENIDGMVTDVPGLYLTVYCADCVPIYLVDPVKHAIGLVHAGWRGTVDNMACALLNKMQECFGSNPEDCLVTIGPSICKECYEVGEDLAELFTEKMQLTAAEEVVYRAGYSKPHISLQEANRLLFLRGGVRPEHIQIADLCTKCRNDMFFSHRDMGKKRGQQIAVLGMKP